MEVVYHPAARAELQRAVRWYERERRGLGLAFLAIVRDGETRLVEYPDLGAPLGTSRRYVLRRFPYSIIYRRTAETLYILAIAHGRRRPDYWRHRQ